MLSSDSAHIYHQHPSFKRTGNDLLVLLTLGSVDSTVRRVVTEWAFSHGGRSAYERTISDLQDPQTCEQLVLILAALLCYQRLLDTSQGTTGTTNGSYLADFNALLQCKPLNNEQATLEQMILSALRVLKTFKDQSQKLRQFLAAVLSIPTPLLHHCDGLSDQYLARRFECRLGHDGAVEKIKLQALMECIIELGLQTGDEMVMFDEEMVMVDEETDDEETVMDAEETPIGDDRVPIWFMGGRLRLRG